MKRLMAAGALCVFLLPACRNGQESQGHTHAEDVTVSHMARSESTELFVEFKPLVAGKVVTFTAHYTDLRTFRPVTKGKVTVSLVKGSRGSRSSVNEPAQPGIFRPSIKPGAAGTYDLWFRIESGSFSDKVVIREVAVYADQASADTSLATPEEDANAITFLKEQAWKVGLAVTPAVNDSIREIIRTGGEIHPSRGDEVVVPATASGIVLFNLNNTYMGNAVNKGSVLFTIGGGGMADDNIETEFRQASAGYDKAKATYERMAGLYESNIIPRAEFEAATLEYEMARSHYQNIASRYGTGGKNIITSIGGFIKHIFVTEGQYVQTGDPLAVVAQHRRLTLQADVPQHLHPKLGEIVTATFKPAGDDHVYDISDFNGRLLAYGKSVSAEEPFLPVQFEIDNKGQLLPGCFVEVFLGLKTKTRAVVLPVAALLEDQGYFSAFVQTGGETYERRDVVPGVTDGRMVEIKSGLSEGEWVVTEGAYHVKMAGLSAVVPAHGHTH